MEAPEFKKGMFTPWGQAQVVEHLGDGVYSVDTASHGGLFVPDELLPYVSQVGRDHGRRWTSTDNWFEEDESWAFVAVALPWLFQGHNIGSAIMTVWRYFQRQKELKEQAARGR